MICREPKKLSEPIFAFTLLYAVKSLYSFMASVDARMHLYPILLGL